MTANPKQSGAAKGQGQMIGREEVNVQKAGSHKSFDVKDVTCSGVECGAIPMAQGREGFYLCVYSIMHLSDGSHYKDSLTEQTVLQSPLIKQDDTVALGHYSAGDSAETRTKASREGNRHDSKFTLARVETTSMQRAGMGRAGASRAPRRGCQLCAEG